MEIFAGFTELVEENKFVPIRELIFQYLRELIVRGKLVPEDPLIEEDLAKGFNVSRTPVREAIRKLELEGLVRRNPRRGVVVRKFTLDDIEEIYDLRSVLEGYAARLAAKNIAPEKIEKLELLHKQMTDSISCGNSKDEMKYHKQWHFTLYAASNNSRLEKLLMDYADYLQYFRLVSLKNPGRLDETIWQHQLLIQAISSGDGELAEKRAREHVMLGKEAFLQQWPELREC